MAEEAALPVAPHQRPARLLHLEAEEVGALRPLAEMPEQRRPEGGVEVVCR